jgi:small subunit ribosomal protein S21
MSFFRKTRDSIEIEVYPKEGESTDSLIRRFRKKVNNSGILKEARKHDFYEKPSAVRRRKKVEATIRCRSEESKKEKIQENER